MSYDVYFNADMGLGPDNPWIESGDRNYTSNVGRMWAEAIGEQGDDGEYQTLGSVIDWHPLASDLLPFVEVRRGSHAS